MLLRFSVENWMSFRDEATLNMVATREEQHAGHIATTGKNDLKLLPVAVVYGANASGKSNLVKALQFAQQFITDPPKPDAPIQVRPYRLSKESGNHPTTFRFEFLLEETIYEYRFSVTAIKVLEEELKQISTKEDSLFRRKSGAPEITLSPKIQDQERQKFAFSGTNDNQLYLTNSVSQKLTDFRPVFDWFKNKLVVILPESRFRNISNMTNEDHPLFEKLTGRLKKLDSGISSLRHVKVSPESIIPKALVEHFSASLQEGHSIALPFQHGDIGVLLRKEKGVITVKRLASIHQNEQGEDVPFSISEESDGTRRLFDILPAFIDLEENLPYVFVIDELDRSLHSLLTKTLLESYLAKQRTTTARSQLIFTTHDTQLMTQEIFRRDEIWITERDPFGASKLIAFSEFKDVRKDKDIRKSYLQGRMGGVPRIRTANTVCEDEVETR